MSHVKADQPSSEAYACGAWLLMCEAAALRAIAEVEAGAGGAFLDSGEPTILYEPHVFHRLTRGQWDGRREPNAPMSEAWGELSRPNWVPGTYGPTRVQHTRLAAAAQLDRDAALRSCSWGLYQIMPTPETLWCCFGSLQRFVNAMYRDVDDHLRALVFFIRLDPRLVDAIRWKDWESFARVYNGPGHATNRYAPRMAEAYERGRL